MNNKQVLFGNNLKALRSKKGIKQQELADEIGAVRQTISNWERNMGKPDIYQVADVSKVLGVSLDELVFGKYPVVYKEEEDMICDGVVSYIDSIKEKGFYNIIDDDILEFFPVIKIDFPEIMGIVVGLKESGYQIVDIFANGFGIYLPTDEDALSFSVSLRRVIDYFIHDEEELSVIYRKNIESRICKVKSDVINEVRRDILKIEDMAYYWVDAYDRIRGYSASKEGCMEQAKNQGCLEYNIYIFFEEMN